MPRKGLSLIGVAAVIALCLVSKAAIHQPSVTDEKTITSDLGEQKYCLYSEIQPNKYQQHPLKLVEDEFVAICKTGIDEKQFAAVNERYGVKLIQKYDRGTRWVYRLKLPDELELNDVLTPFGEQQLLEWANKYWNEKLFEFTLPTFINSTPYGNEPLVLTDEFVVSLKQPGNPGYEDRLEALNREHHIVIVHRRIRSAPPNYGEYLYLLRITWKSNLNTLDMANLYQQQDFVEWAEPNMLMKLHLNSMPNDQYFKKPFQGDKPNQGGYNQWYLDDDENNVDIDAPQAWDITTGDTYSPVVIAIIDSGLDLDHPDLQDKIIVHEKFLLSIDLKFQSDLDKSIISKELSDKFEFKRILLSDNATISIEETGNKWLMVDEQAGTGMGWPIYKRYGEQSATYIIRREENELRVSRFLGNFAPGEYGQPPEDTEGLHGGHGTQVAGIAAASAHNGQGIAGVARHAKILPVKIPSPLDPYSAGEAIRYAAIYSHVLNCSWTVYPRYVGDKIRPLQEAIECAIREKERLVVCSSGSEDADNRQLANYPSCYNQDYDGVMRIGAIGRDGEKASYSNYGNIDVVAPSSTTISDKDANIVTTQMGGGYGLFGGTSAAAAQVSGAAVLVIGAYQKSHPDQIPPSGEIRRTINLTADDMGDKGEDAFYGHGKLNAFNSRA